MKDQPDREYQAASDRFADRRRFLGLGASAAIGGIGISAISAQPVSATGNLDGADADPSKPRDVIQVRRDHPASWATHDPVLALGEIGFEIGAPNRGGRIKIGDGSTAWSSRPWIDESPWLNLHDFGAVGDGIADDTIALQEALKRASTERRPLWVPAGIYAITSTVFAESGSFGLTLEGDLVIHGIPGLSHILSDEGAVQSSGGGAMMTVAGSLDVDGLTFEGGRRWFRASFPNEDTIPLWRVARCRFINVVAPFRLYGDSKEGEGFERIVIVDNIVHGPHDRDAAATALGFSIPVHVVRSAYVAGNHISGITEEGIRFGLNDFNHTGGSNVQIVGNTVRDVWGRNTGDVHGIRINGQNVTISNNILENILCKGAPHRANVEGIYTKGSRMVISNNVLVNAGTSVGMITAKGGTSIIQGNSLNWDDSVLPSVSQGTGIRTESDNYVITGNLLSGILSFGMSILGTKATSENDGIHLISGNAIVQSPTMTAGMAVDLPSRLTISGNHFSGLSKQTAKAISIHPRALIADTDTNLREPHAVDIVGNVFDEIGDMTEGGVNGILYSLKNIDYPSQLGSLVIKDNVFRAMHLSVFLNSNGAPIDELVMEGNVFQDVVKRRRTTHMSNISVVHIADAASSRKGVATLLSGSTSVTISHNLGSEPHTVAVTPRAPIGTWWVSTVGPSSFDLHVDVAPTADSEVSWLVE